MIVNRLAAAGCLLAILITLATGSMEFVEDVSFPVRLEDCQERDDLQMINPFDCRTYFECSGGSDIHYRTCPFGEYFDSDGCSSRKPHDCTTSWIKRQPTTTARPPPQSRSTTVATIAPTPAPAPVVAIAPLGGAGGTATTTSVCHGQPDGATLRAANGECAAYTICWRGMAHSGQCPSGYSYNAAASRCDTANNDRCRPQAMCPPDGRIWHFRMIGNCTEYNFCYAGQHQVRQCAQGLHFDGAQQRCAQPEVAHCFECPRLDEPAVALVTFRAAKCDEYYICQNTEVVLFKCAAGLHWNEAVQQCDLPENAACLPM